VFGFSYTVAAPKRAVDVPTLIRNQVGEEVKKGFLQDSDLRKFTPRVYPAYLLPKIFILKIPSSIRTNNRIQAIYRIP
jgi:predicted RNase H-like nuclease